MDFDPGAELRDRRRGSKILGRVELFYVRMGGKIINAAGSATEKLEGDTRARDEARGREGKSLQATISEEGKRETVYTGSLSARSGCILVLAVTDQVGNNGRRDRAGREG